MSYEICLSCGEEIKSNKLVVSGTANQTVYFCLACAEKHGGVDSKEFNNFVKKRRKEFFGGRNANPPLFRDIQN